MSAFYVRRRCVTYSCSSICKQLLRKVVHCMFARWHCGAMATVSIYKAKEPRWKLLPIWLCGDDAAFCQITLTSCYILLSRMDSCSVSLPKTSLAVRHILLYTVLNVTFCFCIWEAHFGTFLALFVTVFLKCLNHNVLFDIFSVVGVCWHIGLFHIWEQLPRWITW